MFINNYHIIFAILGIVLPVLLTVSSCKSTGFLMAKAEVNLYTELYPAKPINAPLDIYRTQKPEQEYIEIAEISCSDSNDDWNLEQIQIKAREIGADAIIILGDARSYGIGVPVGDSYVYGGSRGYGITAVAIKYIDE